MNINKMALLTDNHLNFLDSPARKNFYSHINQTECEAILITGDIAEALSVCDILNNLSENTNKKIYLVLGNHDFILALFLIFAKTLEHFAPKIKSLFG